MKYKVCLPHVQDADLLPILKQQRSNLFRAYVNHAADQLTRIMGDSIINNYLTTTQVK